MKKYTITIFICWLLGSNLAFSQVEFDLQDVPFSTRGSYFSFNKIRDRTKTDSLFLHHFIGLDTRTLFSFHPIDDKGKALEYELTATPSSITIKTAEGEAKICFENDKIIRLKSEKIGLKLYTSAFRVPMYLSEKQFRLPGYNRYDRLMITCTKGEVKLVKNEEIDLEKFDEHYQSKDLGTNHIVLSPGNGEVGELVLEEYVTEWQPKEYPLSFEECEKNMKKKFETFLSSAPKVSKEYQVAQELAMYINWSCLVRKRGVMNREGMLMSKNWMNYLWSWDNCFIAMGMAHSHPEIAWNQFMVVFGNQEETGILPDRFRDVFIHYGFTKPPVYGIAIANMMKTGIVDAARLQEAYEPMVRLTNFWLNFRDDDNDGLPQYHHGNDSGWDNGTVFDIGYPVESPDLATFLVLQMDALANMAKKLGRKKEAIAWTQKADDLAEKIISEFWKKDKFVYLHYPSERYNEKGNSLLAYIPMLLGDRLPEAVKSTLVANFKKGDFITEFGVASESTKSELYEPDGYWRGPVWPASTYLIIEGLKNCGEEELAKDIALRFNKLCLKSGFAENYNAITGAPLRDNGYTWSTSVFLSLMYEYDF